MPRNKQPLEQDLLIVINACDRVSYILLGSFLTAYFIRESQDSVVALATYYIITLILRMVGNIIATIMTKRLSEPSVMRLGVIANFIYIATIAFMGADITNHLFLIALLYAIATSFYWLPFNALFQRKVTNKKRAAFIARFQTVSYLVDIIAPVLLGGLISTTNYITATLVVLVVASIQIALSLAITPFKKSQSINQRHANFRKSCQEIRRSREARHCLVSGYFAGLSISDGALNVLTTVLIFDSFKTDLNLGIITSITTLLTILVVNYYKKHYQRGRLTSIIWFGIIPIGGILLLLIIRNDVTLIVYNLCFVVFSRLLLFIRDVAVCNVAGSHQISNSLQEEFIAIREIFLCLGRITGFAIMLVAGVAGGQNSLMIALLALTITILPTGISTAMITKSPSNIGN